MAKVVIDTDSIDWETEEALKTILAVDKLPRFIIVESIEER